VKLKFAVAIAAAVWGVPAGAQQAAPRFAPPNLDAAGVRALAANCAPCHGPGGRPVQGSEVSRLAGRPAVVLGRAMAEYKRGERAGTVMPQIARGYGDDEIAALVAYFAEQAP
jgi:sulfide dehydrogenase cytochrome subunit